MNQKYCPSESQEAIALMARAQYHPILRDYLSAVPNGGFRNPREAQRLKAEGVRAGVSDYLLAYPCGGFHGFWLELKRRVKSKSRVTKEQKMWIDRMVSVGYGADVAYGADHALEILSDYLNRQDQCGN